MFLFSLDAPKYDDRMTSLSLKESSGWVLFLSNLGRG